MCGGTIGPPAMALDGKRVLIVEDEFYVAAELADEVAAAGAKVVGTANTKDAALGIIANTYLDGAVVHIRLAGDADAGFQVADALAKRCIPFIFETAAHPDELPARHVYVPIIYKPFLSGAVRNALESLMRPAQEDHR